MTARNKSKHRNPWAYELAKRGRKGGPHVDRKKEQDRLACRMPVEEEEDCNCDQALHLKELLNEVIENPDAMDALPLHIQTKILKTLDK